LEERPRPGTARLQVAGRIAFEATAARGVRDDRRSRSKTRTEGLERNPVISSRTTW
jgi:hypothetical protein